MDSTRRVSIKALVLDETRTKFLVMKQAEELDGGVWDLPGGGLIWGSDPQIDLPREIEEEMGIVVTEIAKKPSYFFTFEKKAIDGTVFWVANVAYETMLESLDFKPSDECVALRFVTPEEVLELDVIPGVHVLAKMFDPKNHLK